MITYRKAKISDIGAVTDLLYALYKMPREELFAENEEHFANGKMAFFLAFDGERAVGVSHGSLRYEYVSGANDRIKGYLEAVFVHVPVLLLQVTQPGYDRLSQDVEY